MTLWAKEHVVVLSHASSCPLRDAFLGRQSYVLSSAQVIDIKKIQAQGNAERYK
jgi:hypothetical protein